MPIIKLDAIDSTNDYLREMINEPFVEDFTVVTTNYQTKGKGQRGAVWSSQPSKNLMFSVFVDVSEIKVEHPFYLSVVASLSIHKSLQKLLIPQLHIKWPNDILSHHKKVCGILIENVIKDGALNASIIGVGLNINQTSFDDLPNASSLKKITGRFYNLDEVLELIVLNMKRYVSLLKQGEYAMIKEEYLLHLFRKNKPSTFRDAEGNLFSGYIKTVLDSGDLQVLLEDNIITSFALKDITLLY